MEKKIRMAGDAPAKKVVAASLGAALAQVVVWALVTFTSVDALPAGFEVSITVIMAFLLGYVTPPSERDQIVTVETTERAL